MKKTLKDRILLTVVPLIIGIIVSAIIYAYIKVNEIDTSWFNAQSVIGTLLGIWATLIGFVITAVSILIAFNGSSYTEIIRQSGHYFTIMFLYTVTSIVLAIGIAVFLPLYILNACSSVVFCVLFFFIIITIIYFFIDIILLFLILNTINKE